MPLHRAPGSSDGRYPTDETLRAVRAALVRFLAREVGDAEVWRALELLAREAQDRQLNAEHMLIAFKAIWNELATVDRMGDGPDPRRLHDHLVTRCIDAYYERPG